MTPEERNEYPKYRVESAYKIFEAAKVLGKKEFWNSAVDRLYYSVFYSVNTLFVLHDISIKSHSAIKSQFSVHFIKTGKIEKNMASF